MKKISIGNKEVIHLVGIGGIGMSGLAHIMKMMGFYVQGSDIHFNKNIENCKKLGIQVFIGHKVSNIKKATILVKSSAIKINNVELANALKKKLPIYSRAEMLANVISLKKNILVTGSHGKTTTTSLIAKILSSANLDPTIINGGVINSLKNNAKYGKGNWAIVEADESDGSFLKLPLNYSIVTNIDNEHLDFYKNFKNLENSFINFINKTPPIGKSVICIDDKNIKRIIKKIKIKNFVTYGFDKQADVRILNTRYEKQKTIFDVRIKNTGKKDSVIKKINLNLLGKYNVLNSTGAITLCINLGVNEKLIKNSLKNFSGVQRRMTKIFSQKNREFFDDYAHHPTEIKSVIESVKNISRGRELLVIFQPHRYSRVIKLQKEFTKCFLKTDKVLLCPVYPAGEKKNKKYNSLNFAKKINTHSKSQVIIINDYQDLVRFFKKNLINNEIVIGMGAGSISQWIRNLKKDL